MEKALRQLVEPDVIIDNPEVFYLHRVNDGQDVYFMVNTTFTAQTAQVTLHTERVPMLWDPSTGQTRPVAPATYDENHARFSVELPPAGSLFVVPEPIEMPRVVDTNLTIDLMEPGEIGGYGEQPRGFVVVEKDGRRQRFEQVDQTPQQPPLPLDGSWEFSLQNDNALVVDRWLARQETDPEQAAGFAAPGLDTREGWLELTMGAWSYQQPSEPAQPYPIPVWYRVPFQVAIVPNQLSLIVDGFSGSNWRLYINGSQVDDELVRSKIDSQMRSLDITRFVHPGENLIALRLVLTGPTDGLLDLIKLVGDFRVASGTIIAAARAIQPADWTRQGYPYYSGTGSYRTHFNLPEAFGGKRIFLRPRLFQDTLEVLVNGQSAGVRLWPPYDVEITGLLRPGENALELRVANTLVNLLEKVERPSGLASAPELVARSGFCFEIGGVNH